ncbi:hypothetical protein DM02DRAFT_466229, partial [Periconia macrospinosa]
ALAYIDSLPPGAPFAYTKIAARFGVERRQLARRHQGKSTSRTTKYANQSKLSPQEEDYLVKYIRELTSRRLPPTRSMIKNFAELVAGEAVSKRWISRFLTRHHQKLTSRWNVCMDRNRHKADSVVK